ncbi:unnamed protein product, partial [Sphacelaria rigidula]
IFADLWIFFGAFDADFMATNVSVHRVPRGQPREGSGYPFCARYACPGAAAIDVLAQDVALTPGLSEKGLYFCFPPVCMVGGVLQRMGECRARAVVVVPATKGAWYPRLRSAR